PGTADEQDDVLAAKRRPQLLDPVHVDDGGAMNPDEALWIKLGLEVVHRLAEQMRLLSDMEAHVVAGRLAPVDVGGADEVHAAARLDHQPIHDGLPPSDFREQSQALAAQGVGLPLRKLLAHMRERRLEALSAERLEQVIEGVDLE